MISPESMTKINSLRQKMAQGEEVTIEEQIEAVRMLRQDRLSAASASAASGVKRAAKAAVLNVSGDDLLGEMMG